MKRHLLSLVTMLLIGSASLWGQTNLAGRAYHHPNIMADQLNEAMKDLNKEDARNKAIAKAEAKKGRKLTAAETAEVDKNLDKAIATANAIKKGMKTAVTIEFKDEKNLVMKADMQINDDALKAAGMGWLKRKALKAAIAASPSSEKAIYVAKGQQVIMIDKDGERDTLQLSQDGQYLSGKLGAKTPFKLKRTK